MERSTIILVIFVAVLIVGLVNGLLWLVYPSRHNETTGIWPRVAKVSTANDAQVFRARLFGCAIAIFSTMMLISAIRELLGLLGGQ